MFWLVEKPGDHPPLTRRFGDAIALLQGFNSAVALYKALPT